MANSSSQLGCNDIQANYELENDYFEFFEKCDYVTSDNQTIINKKRQDDLFLMHFNIRSLQKHINELNNIIAGFDDKPKIIAISVTKLQEGKIYQNIELDGYQFIHRDSITSAGGVGLYISNSLVFSVNPCSNLRLSNAEHLWVWFENKPRYCSSRGCLPAPGKLYTCHWWFQCKFKYADSLLRKTVLLSRRV